MATRLLTRQQASVRAYVDAEELALKAAQYFARLADQYVIGNGHFTVALSGGSTPQAMLRVLAQEPFFSTVPWSMIYFFWSDERCVPPEHDESNFRVAQELLLAKVPVNPENVFRFRGEISDPELAAQDYEKTLRNFFIMGPGTDRRGTAPLSLFPRFDLIFLGMGADGHTASLFPGSPALQVTNRSVCAHYVERLQAHRLTLTVPTINNARNVTFLVSGADKAETFRQVMEGPARPDVLPSQSIKPGNGTLLWLVDEPAAARLAR